MVNIDGEFIPTWNFAEVAASDDISQRAAQRENSTRIAVAQTTHVSNGVGQQRLGRPFAFPIVFREAPHVATGSAVVTNPDDHIWHDPVANAGVYAWVRDSRGHYTGAQVWIRVDAHLIEAYLPSSASGPLALNTAAPPPMKVRHYFTFTGIAVKDLASFRGAKNLSTLTPHSVGI